VRVQRVRREGENVLVCADQPKPPKRQLRGSRL
jgi:hypothetical protein